MDKISRPKMHTFKYKQVLLQNCACITCIIGFRKAFENELGNPGTSCTGYSRKTTGKQRKDALHTSVKMTYPF